MPNGNFQKGTWIQLPSNCSRDYGLTFTRCAAYGTYAITACLQWITNVVTTCALWAQQTSQQCISWAQQTSSQCCTWWPCSWACAVVMVIVQVFCAIWQVIVTWVCLLFAIIVTVVSAVAAVLVYIFCLLWTVISIIFCVSNMNGGTAFLLTDGTVMMQECQFDMATTRWWKLTPDQTGSYANGTWSRLADSNLGRKYFASAVLADGRVLVCGGEYTQLYSNTPDENNTCEIYDPVADTWSFINQPVSAGSPPVVWSQIGDSPCALLPDGTFLLGSNNNSNVAKLDPATMTWTPMNTRPSVGESSEDSWVLMPDNTISAPSCNNPPTTWVYDIANDQWNQGNNLPTSIVLAPPGDVAETGAGLLRYDGTAFFLGGNQHTGVYSPGGNPQWSNGGDLPAQGGQNIGIMDGPGALLVNGNILFGAAPINPNATTADQSYLSPCSYFEFDGSTFNRTNDPPNNNCPTYVTRLLLLPNGDIMFAREDDSSFYAYHSDAAQPQDSFRPVIQTCPANIQAGSTIQVSGTQFNGLSQAVAYGDDSQTATNYPLVRIVNQQSNHVRYCRTFNHTTVDGNGNTIPSMGVATGAAVITTSVAIPADLETGGASLFVVANGIPSQPVGVTISSPQSDSRRGGK